MVEEVTDIRICSLMSWSLAKVVEEIELIGLLKKKINFFLFLRTNLIRLFAIFPRTFQRGSLSHLGIFKTLLGTLMLLVLSQTVREWIPCSHFEYMVMIVENVYK